MTFETSKGRIIPSLEQLRWEKAKLIRRAKWRKAIGSFIAGFSIMLCSGAMILVLFLPVLEVSGSSMEPTLKDGDVLLLAHDSNIQSGELCGMYAHDRLILKRVIALSGDVVTMDEYGNVFVNNLALTEPYVKEKSLGNCDVTFPFVVPEGCLFVMGDHRLTSIDSRSSLIGCIEQDQVVGQVVARIWPLNHIGIIN